MHDVNLIVTIALGFVLAFVFGSFANRLRLPPLVGYLIAGIVMARLIPGYKPDTALTNQLAEIGVMLLMFGVGLHFSVPALMAVRRVAIPGALCQIVIATGIGVVMAKFWGWTFGGGLVLGLCLSVASTVVLLKALEERNSVETTNGRIAVGWLIVEDLAMVLVLVLLPALAEALGGHVPTGSHEPVASGLGPILLNLVITLAKVAAFVGLSLFFGPRVLPWLLRQVARTGSRELFTLGVLSMALGLAFGASKLFGVSFALGAFFAGVVLSESDLSHKAAANSLPLQDAFSVLFFVSVGMLFDPHILVEQPLMVIAVLALILVGKSIVALAIVMTLGHPLSTALMISASLAQIGEFSFILAGLGIDYGLMPAEGYSLVLAGAILSITINPVIFSSVDFINARIKASPRLKRWFEDNRATKFGLLQADLATVRRKFEERAAAHKTFTPTELVERFPLFKDLSAEQRETLVLHFESRSAAPGERLIRIGDKGDSVYFISSGEVEVSVANRKFRIGAGGFFGEMALLTGKPRSADVTALDFCKFVTLTQRDFREFLRKYPDIRQQIAELAAARVAMNRQLAADPNAAPGSAAQAQPVTSVPPQAASNLVDTVHPHDPPPESATKA